MRRIAIIVALLILVPIAEIAVLVAVGNQIGVPLTLALMLGTSLLGAWLLRREGGRAWRVFQEDLTSGRPPGPAATDGLLVLIGGIFMLVPGFVSDVIGLVMIAPPTRRLTRGVMQNVLTRRLSPQVSTGLFGPRRVRVRTGAPEQRRDGDAPPTIEGEIM